MFLAVGQAIRGVRGVLPQDWIIDGPDEAGLTLALAHGAGAPMDSPFMTEIAAAIALAGDGRWRVLRFEFPYMAGRWQGGGWRPPDRPAVLMESWRAVIAAHDPKRLVVGGKSMGGRIASMAADEAGVAGLVCLGYPFHPPGKPERTRTDHLAHLKTPSLFVQGTRDPLGNREEVEGYSLSPAISLCWLPDGNHDLAPRTSSGISRAENMSRASNAVAGFLADLA